MRTGFWVVAMLFVLSTTPASTQEKGGVDLHGPYDIVPNWLQPIEEGVTTYMVSVFVESRDRILVTATGAAPGKQVGVIDLKKPGTKLDHLMVVLDRNGKVVEEWRQWFPLWGQPHAARVNPYDPERHVWFLDRASHQIFKFTRDGKTLVQTLGEKGVTAVDEKHFGRPAEIAWLPDGTAFVADGYGNRRVVKLDKDGKFLKAWGTEGKGPGQFGGVVHCVAVDARTRRVYVADGGNRRVQIFDDEGKYLDEWAVPDPRHIVVTQDQSVWILDQYANRILKYSPEGKLLTYWGAYGVEGTGLFNGSHDFSVDPDGNLYINHALNHTIDKYVPRPTADKSRLVGQPQKVAR